MRLYVNIDHVATLRQARRADEPDPISAAALAESAGADGITAHLREDRRHVSDADLIGLAGAVTTVLNAELAVASDVVELVCRLKPFQATLVPERREEVTTEGGLDLSRKDSRLEAAIQALMAAGTRVSLFIDPDPDTIRMAVALGVPAIELHTGRYARTWREGPAALRDLAAAAGLARREGLAVHAGHGLTYLNVQPVVTIPEIEEVNIGHSIVSRAVMTGMAEAVGTMRQLIDEVRPPR